VSQSELTAATPAGRRLRLRSRVARLRATHSYRTVLALILASFFFASTAPDAAWATSSLLVLQGITLASAIWTSGLAHARSRLLIAFLATVTLVAVALLFHDSKRLLGVAVIAVGVIDQDEVNAQSVTGAVCIYLLFGILFLFVYSAVALLGAGHFFAQGTDGTRAIRLYFSYITLATVGYGDYTPAGNLGHTLAVLEALIGQLYLVTVLALLVSRMRGVRRERRD
jgi:ion channel